MPAILIGLLACVGVFFVTQIAEAIFEAIFSRVGVLFVFLVSLGRVRMPVESSMTVSLGMLFLVLLLSGVALLRN